MRSRPSDWKPGSTWYPTVLTALVTTGWWVEMCSSYGHESRRHPTETGSLVQVLCPPEHRVGTVVMFRDPTARRLVKCRKPRSASQHNQPHRERTQQHQKIVACLARGTSTKQRSICCHHEPAGSTRGIPRDNCSPRCRCSDQGEFEAFLHGEVDACRAVDTMHLSVGKGAALDSASVTRVSVMATSSQYSTLAPSHNWFQKQTTNG